MRLFILSEGLVVTLMVSLMQTQDIKDCEERCREVEVEKESRCGIFIQRVVFREPFKKEKEKKIIKSFKISPPPI